MYKKIHTLDQLVSFCAEHGLTKFSAEETGYQLSVQIPSVYESFEEQSNDSMLYGKVKIFHTGRNRNGSNVTKEAAEACLSSIAYKPLLANFCEVDGEKDFTSHDMDIDDEGNVTYIEHQVGCFTVDEPYMEYDEETDRYYVYAYVAIPREYTDAADIIERKGGTKVSAELAVNSMSYDAKNKELLLEDIEVMGCTCLGKNPNTGADIEEGMQGARLDIADFSIQKNSVQFERDEKLIAMLEELTAKVDALASTTIDKDFQEGGKKMFEELLEKYGKTVEDIDFDYSEMSDEELEAAFAEAFESDPTPEDPADPEPEDNPEGGEPENDPEKDPELNPEEDFEGDSEGNPEDEPTETFSRTFEISHDDIRCALYGLIAPYEEADNEWYFISAVYDDHFVMESWSGQIWGCKYSKDNDTVTLDGERYKLYREYITETEYQQLQDMRANYSSIAEKLAKYEAEPQKLAVLNSEDYVSIADVEAFVALKEEKNHFDLSVEEVTAEADKILLEYAKHNKIEFSENPVVGMHKLPTKKSTKKARYGNFFKK